MAHENPSDELILANLGTPAAPTAAAVRAFLAEFLGDPMVVEKPRWLWLPILHGIVLRVRPAKVAKAYEEIWSPAGSPLAAGTVALAQAVQARLAGANVRVVHCYRYGSPNLAERLAESRRLFPDSTHPIRVVPLFPQRTASSSGTLVKLVEQLARKHELTERLGVAELSPVDPGYIHALAEGIRAAAAELQAPAATPGQTQAPQRPHLVASFHGIPEYVNDKEGARYTADCQATYEALLAQLDWPCEHATLAYQSRFGRDPWIGPATDAVLGALPTRGIRDVIVTTPGFLTAGLETIEELGLRGRADFMEAGGQRFVLAPPPVATTSAHPLPHPRFVEALAALASPTSSAPT